MASKNINDDFDDFFGEATDTKVVDTRPDGRLLKIPLVRLSPNGVNPRTDFGTRDDLLDFGKSLVRHQNQPCPVVSRPAYLKLWPEHAQRVGDVDFVLVCGERRFRAATEVGMEALQCVVDDNVASSRKKFMEAVISENIDRRNFDPIEEANAVAAMAAEFESNVQVAEHFERAGAWVTQRINLTYLTAEIQDMVRRREIPLEDARTLGQQVKTGAVSDAFQDQLAWWETRKEEKARQAAARQAEKAARKAASRQTVTEPVPVTASPSFTAVKPPVVPALPEAFNAGPRAEEAEVEQDQPVEPEQPAADDPSPAPGDMPNPRTSTDEPEEPTAPQPEEAQEPSTAGPVTAPGPNPSAASGPRTAGLMALPERQRSQLLHEYVKHAGSVEAMVADLSRGLPEDRVLQLGQILRDVANGMLQRVATPV